MNPPLPLIKVIRCHAPRWLLQPMLLFCLLFPHLQSARAASIDSTATIGYDSRYVLYGYRLSRHLYHADLYLSSALDAQTTVWGGGWYGYLTDGTYHEIDLYTGVDRTLTDTLSGGVAYSLFNYLEVPFETSDQSHEFAMHLSYASGPVFLQVRDQYDTEANGHILRAIGEFYQTLNGQLSLTLSAEYGYALRYYIDNNLPNHALFTLKAPYAINETLTLTPFIAYTLPLAAIDDFEEEELYGGVAMSFSW